MASRSMLCHFAAFSRWKDKDFPTKGSNYLNYISWTLKTVCENLWIRVAWRIEETGHICNKKKELPHCSRRDWLQNCKLKDRRTKETRLVANSIRNRVNNDRRTKKEDDGKKIERKRRKRKKNKRENSICSRDEEKPEIRFVRTIDQNPRLAGSRPTSFPSKRFDELTPT